MRVAADQREHTIDCRLGQVLGDPSDVQREEELAHHRLAARDDVQHAVSGRESQKGLYLTSSNLDWEVIVVDDASPDGTQDVAKQLAKVYGEDRVVRGSLRRLRGHG